MPMNSVRLYGHTEVLVSFREGVVMYQRSCSTFFVWAYPQCADPSNPQR